MADVAEDVDEGTSTGTTGPTASEEAGSNGIPAPQTSGTVELIYSKGLSRADILGQVFQPKIVKVEVPEWGGHVFVKELSGKERDAFEVSQLEGRGANRRVNLINMRAKLVAFSTVDKTGARVFTDKDVAKLGDLSAKALTRVFQMASDLSGLTPEDVEELTQELGEGRSASGGSN